MAVVFRGVHRGEGQEVAIKVVTAQKARQPRYRRAFRNEVQSVARLHHPHVVEVLDVGQLSDKIQRQSDGKLVAGSPYLVMEYVTEGTLSEFAPQLDWRGVKRFLTTMLDALAHAHARQVIHRDLKPDNVLIAVDERDQWQPKLTDFGIARALDEETFEGKGDVDEWITGTPKYMAPESIRGLWRQQGPWTDLYGLGCIAWWLCAGQPPFWRGGTTRILQDHVYTPPPRLTPQIGVPDGFENWLWRMLAKKPEDRFQRAADAAYSLLRLGPPAGEVEGAAPIEAVEADGGADVADPTIVDARPAHLEADAGTRQHTVVLPTGGWGDDSQTQDSLASPSEPLAERFDPLPPFLPSWRHERTSPGIQLSGAGLGLYGLRAVPMVDREPTRTLIWDMLRRVRSEQRPRLVVVRGPLGCGKSRLCKWMCQRAHELGCAEYLSATHSANKGPLDGLGPMLARFFRCAGQSPDDIAQTVRHKLRQFEADQAVAHSLAHTLASVVSESAAADTKETFSGVQLGSPEERYAAIARLLEVLGRRRSVMMWLDDVHWSPEAFDFAEHLLEHRSEQFPLLMMLTVRADLARRDERVERKLRAIEEHPAAQPVELGPLRPDDHRQLVSTLLGLDDELVSEVAQRTEGNPLFAVQLVGDWVDRGLLEVGDGGFVLGEGARPVVPDDIHQVWGQRLENLLARFESRASSRMRQALELAAVLGVVVSLHEWRNACVLWGLSPPEDLVDSLYGLGLAEPAADGWSFAHGLLAESLQRSASEAGHLQAMHRLCARMLAETYHAGSRGIAERRARHLLAAGDDRPALEPLLQAASDAEQSNEYDLALDLLDQRQAAIERLDVPRRGREMAQNATLRALVSIGCSSVEGALEGVEWVEHVARDEDWSDELNLALHVRASAFRRQGRLRESLEQSQMALEALAGDRPVARAETLTGQGFSHIRLGEHREALACFEEAIAWAEQAEDVRLTQRCLVRLLFIHIQQARWEETRRTVERTQTLLEKTRTPLVEGHCWNALGEVARFHRRWDTARAHYQKAAHIWDSIDHLNGYVARCNLAMVDLAEGRFAPARQSLREVRPAYVMSGYEAGLPLVDLGLVGCAAAAGDWDGFDRHLEHARQWLETTGRVDREVAWLAELGRDLADEGGFADRAQVLERIAGAQWDQLGEADEPS